VYWRRRGERDMQTRGGELGHLAGKKKQTTHQIGPKKTATVPRPLTVGDNWDVVRGARNFTTQDGGGR